MPDVRRVLAFMRDFSEAVRSGRHAGHTGKRITDIVNIGIGGSDLGPVMVCEALKPYAGSSLRAHFVSNVDGTHLVETLKDLDAAKPRCSSSASKTFTTQETLTNARSARDWLVAKLGSEQAVAKHFAAVSTNLEATAKFGIDPANMFEFWDWVGGRYSLWSAIGLPIALYIGMDRFEELLAGAYAMDEHFRTPRLDRNIPVLMGLLGIWYGNFFGACARRPPLRPVPAPLPCLLQQLDMESNGKRVDRDGNTVDYRHRHGHLGRARHQRPARLLPAHPSGHADDARGFPRADAHPQPARRAPHHPARQLFCADRSADGRQDRGRSRAELEAQGLHGEALEALLPHKIFPGNKPTNTLLFDKLDPHTLGMLIALYEHKVFVQSVVWNINPFDQWGVELGKQLAGKILPELRDAAVCRA